MRYWLLFLAALPAAGATCESLASSLANSRTVIAVAAVAPAGSFTPPVGQPIPNLPAFCRVAGALHPTRDSDIQFEVWMPAEGWNGKFQGVGNGGFAGTISYGQMATALRKGYATASTDTGHKAGGPTPDASWAMGHPEKVVDFGHRAIHEMSVTAKGAVAAFYGDAPKRSYFSSCSNGGRQALMEAQRYPGDYDGIIAGAPANYWTHLLSNSVRVANAMTDGYIPAAKLTAIENAALAACDARDGVKDGVMDRPDQCDFKPSSLLCKEADSDACLTAAQVAGLEKVLGGIHGSKGRLYPGFVVGGMPGQGGWLDWITGGAPARSLAYGFGNNFFTNIVYEDKAWDYRKFDPDRDTAKADQKTAAALNATSPDLSKFRARGGKLILYHGWSDAAITPLNAIDYYQSIKDPSGFVELFMVPGMQHCGGGPGPNNFGQGSPGASGDAEHDVNAAIERWVEQGVAPKQLIATRPGRSRPLCPWPQTAHYKGSGSTDDAANFECR